MILTERKLFLTEDNFKTIACKEIFFLSGEIPLTCPNECHDHGNCHLGKCHCFPGFIGPDCADSK